MGGRLAVLTAIHTAQHDLQDALTGQCPVPTVHEWHCVDHVSELRVARLLS